MQDILSSFLTQFQTRIPRNLNQVNTFIHQIYVILNHFQYHVRFIIRIVYYSQVINNINIGIAISSGVNFDNFPLILVPLENDLRNDLFFKKFLVCVIKLNLYALPSKSQFKYQEQFSHLNGKKCNLPFLNSALIHETSSLRNRYRITCTRQLFQYIQ